MENISPSEYDLKIFLGLCVSALGRFVPSKKNFMRGNNMSFMNKNLKKTYMKRTSLGDRFLKDKSSTNKIVHNKQ